MFIISFYLFDPYAELLPYFTQNLTYDEDNLRVSARFGPPGAMDVTISNEGGEIYHRTISGGESSSAIHDAGTYTITIENEFGTDEDQLIIGCIALYRVFHH